MVHIDEGPFTFQKGGHHGVIPACGIYFALIMGGMNEHIDVVGAK